MREGEFNSCDVVGVREDRGEGEGREDVVDVNDALDSSVIRLS